MKKPTKRGGARPGAGAPKKGNVRLTCCVDPETKKALGEKPGAEIDRWRDIVKGKGEKK